MLTRLNQVLSINRVLHVSVLLLLLLLLQEQKCCELICEINKKNKQTNKQTRLECGTGRRKEISAEISDHIGDSQRHFLANPFPERFFQRADKKYWGSYWRTRALANQKNQSMIPASRIHNAN
jgi:hypothetical protein